MTLKVFPDILSNLKPNIIGITSFLYAKLLKSKEVQIDSYFQCAHPNS